MVSLGPLVSAQCTQLLHVANLYIVPEMTDELVCWTHTRNACNSGWGSRCKCLYSRGIVWPNRGEISVVNGVN
jgi:hypothetical protein